MISIYVIHEQPWYLKAFPSVVDITNLEALQYRNSIHVVLMQITEVELFAVMRLLAPLSDMNKIAQVSIGNETYYLGSLENIEQSLRRVVWVVQ